MTAATKTLSEEIQQARQDMFQFAETPFGKETDKALEECGEVLVESLNALYSLWNLTMMQSVEAEDLQLAVKVVADTGQRLRQSALDHGLVECHENSEVLKPGPQLMNGINATFTLRQILGCPEVAS